VLLGCCCCVSREIERELKNKEERREGKRKKGTNTRHTTRTHRLWGFCSPCTWSISPLACVFTSFRSHFSALPAPTTSARRSGRRTSKARACSSPVPDPSGEMGQKQSMPVCLFFFLLFFSFGCRHGVLWLDKPWA
jgi:hypothetical protein